MRTLVLATGLVGKFAQLALPNTNKVGGTECNKVWGRGGGH